MTAKTILAQIPRSIWALGLVSLFMDTSSELIHSLLPVFMVSTLGASMTSVGIVEGIAEATALIVKIFSGTLSDYFRKRKLLVAIGYGMAALTKPLFPLAHSIPTVLTARFIDRIGKGIRGAPRDALVGDIASPEIRGACFGLRLPWVHFSAPCWRSRECCCWQIIPAQSCGLPSFLPVLLSSYLSSV